MERNKAPFREQSLTRGLPNSEIRTASPDQIKPVEFEADVQSEVTHFVRQRERNNHTSLTCQIRRWESRGGDRGLMFPRGASTLASFRWVLPSIAFVVLIIGLSVGYSQTASSPEGSRGTEEQELIRARRANEEAQAEYYRLQAEKLRQPLPTKSIWESLSENPASILGGLAAFVALISFIFNYRATLQNQRDTQFYEALKRLGDKDSPTVRCSAAGLLSQMGRLPVVPPKTDVGKQRLKGCTGRALFPCHRANGNTFERHSTNSWPAYRWNKTPFV